MQILIVLGAVVVFGFFVTFRRTRMPGTGSMDRHGWMSERWLAEHRASHAP